MCSDVSGRKNVFTNINILFIKLKLAVMLAEPIFLIFNLLDL